MDIQKIADRAGELAEMTMRQLRLQHPDNDSGTVSGLQWDGVPKRRLVADILFDEFDGQDEPTYVWWVWRCRDEGYWSVMASKRTEATYKFEHVNSVASAGFDEIYVAAVDAKRAVQKAKELWSETHTEVNE